MDNRLIQKHDDVCYNRNQNKPLETVGHTCTASNECEVCQGICDNDDECKGELVCIERAARVFQGKVPGCGDGTGVALTDRLCYAPTTLETLEDLGETFSDGSCGGSQKNKCGCKEDPGQQCKQCQGDCNTDDDCAGNLRCYQRDHKDEPTPGCYSLLPFLNPTHDFCYDFCYRNNCSGNGADPSTPCTNGECVCKSGYEGDYCENVIDSTEPTMGVLCKAIHVARDFPHFEGGDVRRITTTLAENLYEIFHEVTQSDAFIAKKTVDGSPPSWLGHKYVWDNIAQNSKWEELCADDVPFTGESDPDGPILCNIGLSEFAEEVRQHIRTATTDVSCWPKLNFYDLKQFGGYRGYCPGVANEYKVLRRAEFQSCVRACDEAGTWCTHFSWRAEAAGVARCTIMNGCGTLEAATTQITYEKTG